MVSLIALISSGKGTWNQVISLIKNEKWDNIFLICNDFAYKNFDIDPSIAIKLNFDRENLEDSFNKISKILKKQIKDFEIAVNLSSGDGMEHMALISAVLKSGLGLRLIYPKNDKIAEFKIIDEIYENQIDNI